MLLLIWVAVKSDNVYKIHLKLNLPRQHIRPHTPVAGEAVEGVFECGGAVVFEEEVAYPCEGVALKHTVQNQYRLTGQNGCNNQYKTNTGTHEMQSSGCLVAVLAEVEGVKLSEGGEFFVCSGWIAHVVSPYKSIA
jgi:hypothetical protein